MRDITRTTTVVDQGRVPDFGSFMRRVFPDDPADDHALLPPVNGQGISLLRRDYETAFNMLHRASEALPALMRQCQTLEAEIRQVRAESKSELDAAISEKGRWQQFAVVLKNRLEDSDREIAQLKRRLDSAEERLAAGRQQANMAEQKASLAIGITTLFHDKIMESFGVGSQAHAALDALVKDTLHHSNGAALPRKPD